MPIELLMRAVEWARIHIDMHIAAEEALRRARMAHAIEIGDQMWAQLWRDSDASPVMCRAVLHETICFVMPLGDLKKYKAKSDLAEAIFGWLRFDS